MERRRALVKGTCGALQAPLYCCIWTNPFWSPCLFCIFCFSAFITVFFVVCFPSIYAHAEFERTECIVTDNSASLADGRTPRLKVNFRAGNNDYQDVLLEHRPFPFEKETSKNAALSWMERYPNGTDVSCYYDPSDHNKLVMNTDYSRYFVLACVLITLVPGCLWCCTVGFCIGNAPIGMFLLAGMVEDDEGVLLPKLTAEQERGRWGPGPPVPVPITEVQTVGGDIFTDMKYAIVRKKPLVPVWFPMRRDHDQNLGNTATTFKMRRMYTRKAILVLLHAHFTEGAGCAFALLPLEVMGHICQLLQQMVREEEQRELRMLRGALRRTAMSSDDLDMDVSTSETNDDLHMDVSTSETSSAGEGGEAGDR